MQAVIVKPADNALETTRRKLDEVLMEDPLTQEILEMKNEQARLKRTSRI